MSTSHTRVRFVTSLGCGMGVASGANVMACVPPAYLVEQGAAIPPPCGPTADGNPGRGGPTLRGSSQQVATTPCLHMSSISIFRM